jgi:3-oxoacyl-[acyl-carrier-protein] synthase III
MNVIIAGTGSYVPEKVVRNQDFPTKLDTCDEWIRSRTGIAERRYAAEHESSSSMGLEAARRALAAANLSATDIDLVICATVTPDLMSPSNACLISAKLGCRFVPAFDLSAACSGFIYALSVGEQFLRTGSAKKALIVGSDLLSRGVDPMDRNTCILFGDGAGAVVLEQNPSEGRGIHRVNLYSDGSRHDLIQMPSRMTPFLQPDLHFVQMNGREVFKFAVHRLIELIQQAESDCQAMGKKLAWIVPHQVNSRIIDAALETIKLPRDRVVLNLDRYGNTSAASIPLALDECVRDQRVKPGDTILMAAFGGGLTWSSALLTM